MKKWLKLLLPTIALCGVVAISTPFLVSCSNNYKDKEIKELSLYHIEYSLYNYVYKENDIIIASNRITILDNEKPKVELYCISKNIILNWY